MNDRQWLRSCSLVVADASGSGIELGELRVTFKVSKGDVETPNSAEIRVYNLAPETVAQIEGEFTRVVLQAGYQSNCTSIFDGSIRGIRTGREGGTDTWLEIIAADSDRAYTYATVNTTLSAGSKPEDRVSACQAAFTAKGAGQGEIQDLGGNGLPRGKVMYGSARKFMRDEAVNTDCTWSFQDGNMQMVKNAGYLSGEAVVLTHETGLVGTPEQTNEGIKVRCLLNPRLRISGRIKLDNASIQEAKTELKASAMRSPAQDADGFYRILKVDYSGDTRGNDWYADLVCVALDASSNQPLDMVK